MRKNSGVTLITLVITIGILLIIVGLTVNVALNGNTFNKSKNSTDNAQSRIEETQKNIDEIKDEWNTIEKENV